MILARSLSINNKKERKEKYNLKTTIVATIVLLLLIGFALRTTQTVAATGTPGSSTGSYASTFVENVIEDGILHALPEPVVSGDVVLLESASGSLNDPSTWSDVLRFSDNPMGPSPFQNYTCTHYQLFSDDGGPGFIDEFTGFTITPAKLSSNPIVIVEVSEPTVFVAGSNTYYIYSDLDGGYGPPPGFTASIYENGTLVTLPQPVVPGDVVLLEDSSGSLNDPDTWSDVLRFSDDPMGPSPFATPTVTHCWLFSDRPVTHNEFIDEKTGFKITTDMLSDNVEAIPEVYGGVPGGMTTYVAGSNTYKIYSDYPEIGGIVIPVNKLSILAPYIGLASVVAIGAIVTLKYRRKKE